MTNPTHWLPSDPTLAALAALAATVSLGYVLGSARVRGISVGSAGVLFAGLLFGHFGLRVDSELLHLARDGGLALCIFAIGLRLGPGFGASLRRQGAGLNLVALACVASACACVVAAAKLTNARWEALGGIYCGAVTNTPSLSAIQQAMAGLPGLAKDANDLPGLGYAVAYPFAVLGIIGSMVVAKLVVPGWRRADDANGGGHGLSLASIRLTSASIEGVAVRDIPGLAERAIVISRRLRGRTAELVTPETILAVGDAITAVGRPGDLAWLRSELGYASLADPRAASDDLASRQAIVTKHPFLGADVEFLRHELPDVVFTRIQRGEVELSPAPGIALQFGDAVQMVGEPGALDAATERLGLAKTEESAPSMAPIAFGLFLGLALGVAPIPIPGLAAPLRLGLAGGTLVIALMLGRVGRVGPISWYLPATAGAVLRDFGMALFLAAVGLKAGQHFVETLIHGDGFKWMAIGIVVTIVPLIVVCLLSKLVLKLDYDTTCGLLAGCTTDPPALAFAASLSRSQAAYLAYSSVYPAVIILRLLSAQALVLYLSAAAAR